MVRRAMLHEVNRAIGGLVIRDAVTGDWLVLLSPRTTPAQRCAIFNSLMAQLDEWDRRGHSTDEVRRYLSQMAV